MKKLESSVVPSGIGRSEGTTTGLISRFWNWSCWGFSTCRTSGAAVAAPVPRQPTRSMTALSARTGASYSVTFFFHEQDTENAVKCGKFALAMASWS